MSIGNGYQWSKFWWDDWQGDAELRMCSLAAQGLWMRLLCIAHKGTPIGHVTINGKVPTIKKLAGYVGATEREVTKLLAELDEAGVFSRTDDGTIYSRRMEKEGKLREAGREAADRRWSANGASHPKGEPNGSGNGLPNGEATREPNALEARSLEAEEREREARARPRPRLPFDWQPSLASIDFGHSLGLSDTQITIAADRMVDWANGGGHKRANWDKKFDLWLREDAQRTRSDAPFRNGALQLIREEGMPSVEVGDPVNAFLARFPNGPH